MKGRFIFAVMIFCHPNIYRADLKRIKNRLALYESEIQFIKGRFCMLDKSAQCWMRYLEDRFDLANKLESRIKELCSCGAKNQRIVAAQYRLYRYLNSLTGRLCDWKKRLNKERLEAEFDIVKFDLPCKKEALAKNKMLLSEPVGCNIDCPADVQSQKAKLVALQQQLPDVDRNIKMHRKAMRRYFAAFDASKDRASAIAVANNMNICPGYCSLKYPYEDIDAILEKAYDDLAVVHRDASFQVLV